MPVVDVHAADAPLILSFPHIGTLVPPDLAARLTPVGATLIDTDWYVDRLYAFVRDLGLTTIRPTFSRYVVDLNRDPNDAPLYPGAPTSTVCPTETFAGEPLYAFGETPDASEIAQRLTVYWQPYHAALAHEIERVRARHGYAIVLDAHSIWGRIPRLFEGELPDVNLGTNGGRSCAPDVTAAVAESLQPHYSQLVVDGRFKGGFITRCYGRPDDGVHAIQIELNQRTYLVAGSRTAWDDAGAGRLAAALRDACERLLDVRPQGPARGVPATTTPAHNVRPSQ